MTFLVFFSGWQFILIPAEVKRTSATLCSFHFLEFFDSSIFWGSSSSRLSLFPILGPHGLPFRRWALILTPSGLLLGFLGPRLAKDPSLASAFFSKESRHELFFLWPKNYKSCFITFLSWFLWCLFLLLLMPLLLLLLSWKPLLGCSLRLLWLCFFNTRKTYG